MQDTERTKSYKDRAFRMSGMWFISLWHIPQRWTWFSIQNHISQS